ncbi:MAG: hypothetical protein ACI8QI_000800 [Limisphaerales bacterium]|jgi:hypothetical protein
MENKENMNEKHSGTWEIVYKSKPRILRLNVPGGWLVTVSGGFSFPVTFYPDPEHKWNPRIK